jgi:RNA polymerase sigma-70 factor (ECF subfamily)
VNGPPRDPAAWLIFGGRNSALDELRRRNRHDALPEDDVIPDGDDNEAAFVERLDSSAYQDDVLRLLFICCQPAPGPVERSERLSTVAAMVYRLFNEGYSASGGDAHVRVPPCEEAIRLGRLLLRLFPAESEIMGLTALMLLQHARAPARLDANSNIVLREDQDRQLWHRNLIAEGLVLVEKAQRSGIPGPYQLQAAIAAVHARAARPTDTDWEQIDRIYAVLEMLQPSPVVTLNRAVAVSKVRGAEAALARTAAEAAHIRMNLDHLDR